MRACNASRAEPARRLVAARGFLWCALVLAAWPCLAADPSDSEDATAPGPREQSLEPPKVDDTAPHEADEDEPAEVENEAASPVLDESGPQTVQPPAPQPDSQGPPTDMEGYVPEPYVVDGEARALDRPRPGPRRPTLIPPEPDVPGWTSAAVAGAGALAGAACLGAGAVVCGASTAAAGFLAAGPIGAQVPACLGALGFGGLAAGSCLGGPGSAAASSYAAAQVAGSLQHADAFWWTLIGGLPGFLIGTVSAPAVLLGVLGYALSASVILTADNPAQDNTLAVVFASLVGSLALGLAMGGVLNLALVPTLTCAGATANNVFWVNSREPAGPKLAPQARSAPMRGHHAALAPSADMRY